MPKRNAVIYPLRLCSLNEFISAANRSRYQANAIKRRCTEACDIYTTIASKHGVAFVWPCTLRFTWVVANRRRDPDNIAYAKKFILDGMQASGFLPNDSLKYITGFRDVFIVAKREEERVIVEMDEEAEERDGTGFKTE